jgi:hypothetical protein
MTLLATAGHDLLTPIMNGADYSMLVKKGISPAICLVSLAALVLLWRRRNTSALDLWLFVVMAAWLCDVGQPLIQQLLTFARRAKADRSDRRPARPEGKDRLHRSGDIKRRRVRVHGSRSAGTTG